MHSPSDPSAAGFFRRPTSWLALFGLWTLPAIATATALHGRLAAQDPMASWWSAFWPQLLYWYPWALATPLVFAFAARWPLRQGRMAGNVARHAFLAWLLGFLFQLYMAATELALFMPDHFGPRALLTPARLRAALLQAFTAYGMYAMILAVAIAWASQRRLAAQEQALTQARLTALHAQLRPHFLFNTLHGIAALTESDPRGARAMTAKLAALLRVMLEAPPGETVPLAHELDTLDRYLEIEALRFADRLRIVREIDPSLGGVRVPPLILQPLAENAIRHGIEARAGSSTLTIGARREADVLVLEIVDDGPGPATDHGGGMGLANVRERLERLYGTAARFELDAVTTGGCRARIVLPLVQG